MRKQRIIEPEVKEKHKEDKKMNSNKSSMVLKFILEAIKTSNIIHHQPMAEDSDNSRLLDIFRFVERNFNISLEDDEDILVKIFGDDGFNRIRDAEAGYYGG